MRASRPDAFVVPIDEPGVAVLLAEFGLEHLDVELRELSGSRAFSSWFSYTMVVGLVFRPDGIRSRPREVIVEPVLERVGTAFEPVDEFTGMEPVLVAVWKKRRMSSRISWSYSASSRRISRVQSRDRATVRGAAARLV